MNGHVEANPELPPLVIRGRLLNEIFTHALQRYPEECCGLLTGTQPGCFDAVHPCWNAIGGGRAFQMNADDYLPILREAEASGARVTGVYHSHVEAAAYFSEEDQRFALQEMYPFPDVDHIVVSVIGREVKEFAAFRWLPGAGRFERRTLEVEAP